MELNLRFPSPDQVIARLDRQTTGPLPFQNPFSPKDHQDLRWYVETYAAHSLGDPDDSEAARIKAKLPDWGHALFQAVFQHPQAQSLWQAFQDAAQPNRLLTLSTSQPAILALPWELLHDGQAHLFHQGVSLRRRLDEAQASPPLNIASKPKLHLLFVISRPQGTGFINPRADAKAVLDALAEHAQGRISAEFLHPASFRALVERLQDDRKPAVDILHFDGHGAFDEASQTGYLLFEDYRGQPEACRGNPRYLPAHDLGKVLHQHNIPLVILSACQSATQGEEPLGSVATGLLAAGIPAVLAMTHSVLVTTTLALFGAFYQALAQGQTLGAALDLARMHLDGHPEKYPARRGQDWVPLKLHDWFVPALYQSGADLPLLEPGSIDSLSLRERVEVRATNLPAEPQAGFHGRTLELWQIERGFALNTRRIAITGFGGQGKTALAQEAGRWLLRTGLCQAAAFVRYAGLQTLDSVALAVNALGETFGRSFPSPADVLNVLAQTPTLIILDNLETLPAESLKELLDSAVAWSQTGATRVLLTSRSPDFQHPAYPAAGGLDYLRVSLSGLGSREQPDDALAWFGELMKRPPEFAPGFSAPTREKLVGLFDKVGFHPLSIHILAVQLKTRRVEELGERLEQLLKPLTPTPLPLAGEGLLLPSPAGGGAGGEGTLDEDIPQGLAASLQLSLDRLEPEIRALLPRLGVFQGGAFENLLLEVTGLDSVQWARLRQQLEVAALAEAESLPGVTVPFLRFSPNLVPLLWLELQNIEQERLSAAHRARYYALARYLYDEDRHNPHAARAIARRELPNLLHALHVALQLDETGALEFSVSVNLFLMLFDMRREAEQVTGLVQALADDIGSEDWILIQSDRCEQLKRTGRAAEAAVVYESILAHLDETAIYRRAIIIGMMGRCFDASGRPDLSVQSQQQALTLLDKLEADEVRKRQRGICLSDLAQGLMEKGQYANARQACIESLSIAKGQNDLRQQGIVLGRLGNLALREGKHVEAIEQYQGALQLFHTLEEPSQEASNLHQLGMVYHMTERWAEAERCYRESVRISESLGNKHDAARTWNQLAMVNASTGKLEAAEQWYRMAISVYRDMNRQMELFCCLDNLASLLRQQPQRLTEARGLAEEALAISQLLEPGIAETWKNYELLAKIAEQEADAPGSSAYKQERRQTARNCRRLALDTYRSFPGNRVLLRQCKHMILVAVGCGLGLTGAIPMLAHYQAKLRQAGPNWVPFADALNTLLKGERDSETLCAGLGCETALIMETILQGIADSTSLDWLIQELGAEDAES